MVYKTISSHNNPGCPNVCPLPVFSKNVASFGGNTNMPGSINSAANRYSQLVSLPFRSRGSGTVVIISNTNASFNYIKPPKNTF